MQLKLTRSDLVNGDIFFRIYQGEECIKAFYAISETDADSEEVKAKEFLSQCVERIQNGFPKECVIEQISIKEIQK